MLWHKLVVNGRSGSLVLGLALTGCVLVMLGCSRERAPATKTDSQRVETAAPRSRHAAALPIPRPLAVGQWVRYELAYSRGPRSSLTYRVVSTDGGALWREVVSGDANAGTVVQLLLQIPETREAKTTQLRGVKLKMPSGTFNLLGASDVAMNRDSYLQLLDPLFVSAPAVGGTTRSLPSGDFDGSTELKRATVIEGQTLDATLWLHNAIPITGLVELHSAELTMSCSAFGESGAASQLPGRQHKAE
jgi:hypothetical protein